MGNMVLSPLSRLFILVALLMHRVEVAHFLKVRF